MVVFIFVVNDRPKILLYEPLGALCRDVWALSMHVFIQVNHKIQTLEVRVREEAFNTLANRSTWLVYSFKACWYYLKQDHAVAIHEPLAES